MQGDLTRETLADVIRTLYVDRRSGIIHLAQGKTSKRIYFRKGSMIFANSDVESDRLGEFLVRQGVIDRTSLDETIKEMNARPTEREASGCNQEGSEDYCFGRLKPKSEIRSTKQIRMTKMPMTKTKNWSAAYRYKMG